MKKQSLPSKADLKKADKNLRSSQRTRATNGGTDEAEETLQEELTRLLEAAKDRFNYASDAWATQRTLALEDVRFFTGDQWDEALKTVGKVRREPTLTVNRLPQFVAQVENELRRQQISINVYPTDEIGSEATADIFAGIIRKIERDSYATSAYIHAAGAPGAMVPGFGFLKLITTYAGSTGFNQDIRITSPADPFKIMVDPDATEPDSSDARYWFEFDDYSEEAYRALFPASQLSSMDVEAPGTGFAKWGGPNGVRVMTYWFKTEVEVIEYLLEDGSTVNSTGWYDPNAEELEQDDLRQPFPKKDNGTSDERLAVLRTREVLDTRVMWATMNGVEVLDQGEWADSEFPFVSIYGPTMIVDGKRDIHGIIRHAKEAQRMLNYMASSAVRRIGSANKAPWVLDAKSIKGYEEIWKKANTENWAALLYNSTDPDNPSKPLPAPVRADQTGQINDLLAAAQKFENDLKSCLGIFDAGLGATPNEQSGVAIKTLAEQGKNANFHYSDATARGIQRLGYLLVRLIPKIIDTPRALRIIGADTTEKMVRVNQVFTEGGEQKNYNLTEGGYGVAVSAGPAYATRKQQALDGIVKLVQADPSILPIIQDVLVSEMDFDGAMVIQERLKKLLAMTHPQLVEDDLGTTKLPPAAQAALGQQTQLIQQLSQQLQLCEQELQKLQFEKATKQIEHGNNMALVLANRDADIMLEQIKGNRDIEAVRSKAQLDAIKANADLEADTKKEYLSHTHETQKLILNAAVKAGPSL